MYKIKIVSVGKIKETWLEEGIEEYTKRLKNIMTIEWLLAKNSSQLTALLEKNPSYVILDPQGIQMTSEELCKHLLKSLIKEGCRLTIVIGGAEGLSTSIKSRASFSLSLSSLTFTHQLTRLILLEQLYRCMEIQKGSAYHK